jgi:hypothetical protein
MESFRESLIAAVEQPPPSGIDIDRLIVGELRSSRFRRAAFVAAGGATAVLLVAGGLVFLRPMIGPAQQAAASGVCAAARPTPSSSAQPTFAGTAVNGVAAPSEPTSDGVARLSAALTDALAANLPGRTVADHLHVGCHWVQFEPNIYPARYYAWADVSGSASGSIVLMVSEQGLPDVGDVGLEPGVGSVYEDVRTMPDGTVVGLFKNSYSQIGARRPDGTGLMLLVPDGQPATVDELIAIIANPRLTLYP